MSYPTRQYVCLVDTYRRPSRRRNTAGRYQVGARSAKEAKRILQKMIGFGSVIIYYEDRNPERVLKRGEAVRVPGISDKTLYLPVRHATAPQKEVNLNG